MKNKFKIAFLVSSFPSTSETFIVNQVCDLLDKGHDVKIFAFNEDTSAVPHQALKSYNLLEKTTYLTTPKISKINRLNRFLRFLFSERGNIDFKKLCQIFNFYKFGKKALNLSYFTNYLWILDKGAFDIVHAHFGQNGAYIAKMKVFGYLKKAKLVASFHGNDIIPARLLDYKENYKDLFRNADLITVNTPYTHSLVTKIATNIKLKILPVGLDTSKFKNLHKKRASGFEILYVGRLIPFKAPNLAIAIIKNLSNRGYSDLKLTVVGEGSLFFELKEQIILSNLEDQVVLTGALTQEEICKKMNESHVFLFPGIYDNENRAETQGLVIQEAQAMELPVIVSDAGGMKYGLKDGETGFVVKEGDIEAFANKVELLFNNENLRSEMGRKGREFVKNNYDSKLLGSKLEKLYWSL